MCFSCYITNIHELNDELVENYDKLDLNISIEKINQDKIPKEWNSKSFITKIGKRGSWVYDSNFTDRNFAASEIVWLNSRNISSIESGTCGEKNYHYCSAITSKNLKKLGGFDQSFAEEYCFDDDMLLCDIKNKLNLNIKLIHPECGYVVHQYHDVYYQNMSKEFTESSHTKNKILFMNKKNAHENEKVLNINNVLKITDISSYKSLVSFLLNQKLYTKSDIKKYIEKDGAPIFKELQKYIADNNTQNVISTETLESEFIYELISYGQDNKYKNVPKIMFTYWDGSNISFLHYLTLYTIKKFNSDYKIVLYIPEYKINTKSWASHENKESYENVDYIDEVLKLGVNVKK